MLALGAVVVVVLGLGLDLRGHDVRFGLGNGQFKEEVVASLLFAKTFSLLSPISWSLVAVSSSSLLVRR